MNVSILSSAYSMQWYGNMSNTRNGKNISYKYCIVPLCKNTTVSAPDKHFFPVPKGQKIREKWYKTMKRRELLSELTTCYCCEEHFDIENDVESPLKYRLFGGKVFLKKNVVPHRFECQNPNKDLPERPAIVKLREAEARRRRAEIIAEILAEDAAASAAPTEFIECVRKVERTKPPDDPDPISVPLDCCDGNSVAESRVKRRKVNGRAVSIGPVQKRKRGRPKDKLATEIPEESKERLEPAEVKNEPVDNSDAATDFDYHRTSLTSSPADTQICTKTHVNEEWEILGNSIGLQLRDVDSKQSIILQKLISEGIFYAKRGLLTHGSRIDLSQAVSNSQKPRVRRQAKRAPRRSKTGKGRGPQNNEDSKPEM